MLRREHQRAYLSKDGKRSHGEQCGEEATQTVTLEWLLSADHIEYLRSDKLGLRTHQHATLNTRIKLLSVNGYSGDFGGSSDITNSFHCQRD